MEHKRLKSAVIMTALLTIAAIVLCIVTARIGDDASESGTRSAKASESGTGDALRDDGFVGETQFHIDKDVYYTFTSLNCDRLYTFGNGVLKIYDADGKCEVHDFEHRVIKANAGNENGRVICFIDSALDMYEFDLDNDRTEKLLSNVCDISYNGLMNGAVTTDAKLYLWGERAAKYIGESADKPREYKSDVRFKKVAFAYSHALALDSEGNVYECEPYGDDARFTKAEGLTDVEFIFCASENIAVEKGGQIHYWQGFADSGDSDPMKDDAAKIEQELIRIKPTSFCMCTSHAVVHDGKNAYRWGENGNSKDGSKSIEYIRSPREFRMAGDFDAIYCCGGVIYVRRGLIITGYKML